jgi:peptide/nickel transport system ATP-binding protein
VDPDVLLEIRNLTVRFHLRQGTVTAVDGVSFRIPRGRILGLVGESGCGKSVTARALLRIEAPGRIEGGEILLHPPGGPSVGIHLLDPWGGDIRSIRGRVISMIFQEPMTSFGPMHTIGNQIRETILLHRTEDRREAERLALQAFRSVGLPRPERVTRQYPHQLSGGMRQRAMIAMALSGQPQLLVADEPTTALDVTTEVQIIDLLKERQASLGMAILYITHNLSVIAGLAESVVVMYLGKIVERADTETLFREARHPYTKALFRSIPRVDREPPKRLEAIQGSLPDPYHRPKGCVYHPRCPESIPGTCESIEPRMTRMQDGAEVACHLYPEGTPGGYTRRVHPEGMPEGALNRGGAKSRDRIAWLPQKTACFWHRPDGSKIPPRLRRSHSLTRSPEMTSDAEMNNNEGPLLEVSDLCKYFPIKGGFFETTRGVVKAVDGVSFGIFRGMTFGLVGESGCGKTTTGRLIVRVLEPTRGNIHFYDREEGKINLSALSARELRPLRRKIQMVFQDPYASLDPRMTVLRIVGEPLRACGPASGKTHKDRVAQALDWVGLKPESMNRYPHAFSGGQRQRIGIARALVTEPDLVVADEPVSALDVSFQAQILNLFQDLRERLRLTYVFVAHDLSVIRHICDHVAVMYLGKLIETANRADLFSRPRHPYTETLISIIPRPDTHWKPERSFLQGSAADLPEVPAGCAFHTRCRYSQPECRVLPPELREVTSDHRVACHFDLPLHGL